MQFFPLVVSHITDETALAKSFTFTVQDKFQSEFQYEAGQFLTLRLPWQESFLDRCYSLSSSPEESEWTITVKRIDEGRISNLLNDTINVGDIVDVAPPSGRFTSSDKKQPLTLFAAGSGITPIISIIKDSLNNTEQNVTLFYANSNPEETIFKQQLDILAEQYPNRFKCHHHLSHSLGRVNENTITHFLADNLEQQFFICGPDGYMNLVENTLQKLGVSDQSLHLERFVSDVVINDQGVEAASDIASFKATLDNESHTVPYLANKTLLESMLAHDLKPAYFCQKAKCGMCTVTKETGEVAMRNSDILSDNDKDKGRILLCQSLPLSNDIHVNCDAD